MLVMTAKVNKKKLAVIAGVIVVAVIGLVLLLGGRDSVSTGTGLTISSNDDRIRFLASYGWEVSTSPAETGQVRIPSQANEVFTRYNALQKTMGYDLSAYAGKTVMRYVYAIKNYSGATEPVYATILICDNRIIGGDITDTSPAGKIQGFTMQND